MEKKKYVVPQHEKLIYASGDLFGGGGQTIVAVIYMIFLTDIIGVNPAWAGTVIMVSKIWDAISDPLMGSISDSTKMKFGRRKPYILGGGILLILAMAFLWYPVTFSSDVLKITYVTITYLFYSTISTVIAVPYGSLSTELSPDFDETNSINLTRLVFSLISTAVCSILPVELFSMLNKNIITVNQFYLAIVVGFGFFFAMPLILTGFLTKERVRSEKNVKVGFEKYKKVFKIKAFRKLLGLYICQSITLDITSAIVMYFSLYIVRGMDATVFMASFLVAQLLMMPVMFKKVESISKTKLYYIGIPLSIICALIVGLFPADGNVIYIYIATALMAIGFVGTQTMCWLIFTDVVDIVELSTNNRIAGCLSGAMTFVRKMASAIAIFMVGVVLDFTGYIQPVGDAVAHTQPNETILGLRFIFIFAWVFIMGIGYFVAKSFKLSPSVSKKVKHILNSESLSKEEEKEKEEILKEFV